MFRRVNESVSRWIDDTFGFAHTFDGLPFGEVTVFVLVVQLLIMMNLLILYPRRPEPPAR